MSFRPHWINPHYFLVRINRADQKKQRETLGDLGLLIADTKNTFMTNNMQHGEIIMIGDDNRENDVDWYENGEKKLPAQKLLPQAREGDTLIFSHFIEGSVESFETKAQEELNNEYLIEQDELFNYYIVPCREVFGVEKPDGEVFTPPDVIFALPHASELGDSSIVESDGGILLFSDFKQTESQIQIELEETKITMQNTVNQDKQKEYLADMERKNAELNKVRLAKFHPIYFHNNFNRDCQRKISRGDVLYYKVKGGRGVELKTYELKHRGTTYNILRANFVEMVSKDEPIVLQVEALTISAEGQLR